MSKTLHIIAPLFNEAENVEELCFQVFKVADSLLKKYRVSLILVDDGSTDNTVSKVAQIQKKEKRIALLQFDKNYGHHIALKAGLDYADGDYNVLIDSDLQDSPLDIPLLFEKINKQVALVYTVRRTKKGSAFKINTSDLFWKWIRLASGLDIVKDQAMLRLFDKKVLNALKSYKVSMPFYAGIFAELPFKYAIHFVEQKDRNAGNSKYSLQKLLKLFFVATFGYGYQLKESIKYLLILLTFFSPIIVAYLPLELNKFILFLILYLSVLLYLCLLFFLLRKFQHKKESVAYNIKRITDNRKL